MYSETFIDHFRNPRNVGELPSPPALVINVSNPACGDLLRLSVLVDRDRIAATAFKVRGCVASIAAGSALTELLKDRTKAELSGIREEDVETAAGGLAPASKHAASLCVEALRALLRVWP